MSGAPICINCITGHLLPGEAKGSEDTVGPYKTYVARPDKPNPSGKKSVIVSFTDVYGLGLKNNKIVADIIADQTGYPVYVPDLFNGKPVDINHIAMPTTTTEVKNTTFYKKMSDGLKMLTVAPWLAVNFPNWKSANVEAYVKALKAEKGFEKVGAVGFCYGGKFAVDLNGKGLIDATVANHPSFTSASSYDNLKAPILFNCAETDDLFPAAVREAVQKKLDSDSKAPAHDFKVFEHCVHGFCARPNFGDERSKKGFEEGTQRASEWFKAHL